ncbi:MAG TPA: AAA family ATPase [Streptosporangiaceae bacterium]
MRPGRIGKSAVARELERQGMTRLSFDQEAWSRGITAMPLPEDVHRDIEHVLRARLADLVRAGSDVVLDFSFWSRRMRDEYREFLSPFGVVPETCTWRPIAPRCSAASLPPSGKRRRLQAQH